MQKSPPGPSENLTAESEKKPSRPLYYDFGPFSLRTRDAVLLRDGLVVPMRHKVLETLRVLVEEHGHFISKTQLLDRVWNGEYVEESSITQNISLLRRVLDPVFPGQKPIETMSKRGYRFALPVNVRHEEEAVPVPAPPGALFRATVAAGTEVETAEDPELAGQFLVFSPSRLADAVLARDRYLAARSRQTHQGGLQEEAVPNGNGRDPSVTGIQQESQQAASFVSETSPGEAANETGTRVAEPAPQVPVSLQEPSPAPPVSASVETNATEAATQLPAQVVPAPLLGSFEVPQEKTDVGPLAEQVRKGKFRWWTAATAVVCTALLIFGGLLLRHHLRRVSAIDHTVAILTLRNLNEDAHQEWVGTAVSEMVSAGLQTNSSLSIVRGASVMRMQRDLSLPTTVSLAQDTAANVCRYLNCTHIITGSYLASESHIWLDMKLQDATGDTLRSVSAGGKVSDLNRLVSESTAQLRSTLDLDASPPYRGLPQFDAALREYSVGLENLQMDDLPAAYAMLLQATHDAPASPLALYALAQTWSRMGYAEEAARTAARAASLSESLTLEQREQVQAFAAATSRKWPEAVRLYDMLYRQRPEDEGALLDLVRVERDATRNADAVRLLENSGLLQRPAVLLQLAYVRLELGDHKGALAAATESDKLAVRANATSMAAEAAVIEAYAQGKSGAVLQAINAIDALLGKIKANGNQQLLGQALRYQAAFLRQKGDLVRAETEYEEALHLAEATGDRASTVDALSGLGNVQRNLNHMTAAKESFRRGLDLARDIGDKRRIASMLLNVANTTNNLGDPDTAVKQQQEALTLAQQVQDRYLVMNLTGNMGVIFAHQGDYDHGERLLESAVRQARDLAVPHMEAYYEGHLVSVNLYQGRPADAFRLAEHSCGIFHSLKEARYEAGCMVQLASLEGQSNRCADAHHILRPVLATYQDSDLAARAWQAEAECLLKEGRVPEARAAGITLTRLASQSLNSEDFMIPNGILNARIALAEGRDRQAEEQLVVLAERSRSLHLLPRELEVRLLLAELHKRIGSAQAPTELRAIAAVASRNHLAYFQQLAERD